MCNNFHLQERYVEEHVEEMQREACQRRLVASLSKEHNSVGRHLVSRLGTGLVTLGLWLKRMERSEKQVA